MDSALLVLLVAAVFVFVGNLIGKLVPLLHRFTMPGAVLGGLLAFALGPQLVAPEAWPLLPPDWVATFYGKLASFPGLFINVVFACLMLGRRFGKLSAVWGHARRPIVMGHIYAWGQYTVGLLLVVTVLEPVLGVSPLAGTLIAIGFQGGHGTAAGLGENFRQLDFPQGEAFALTVATVGVLVGVVAGPFLANALRRRPFDLGKDGGGEVRGDDDEPDIPQALKPNPLTGRLTVHLGLIAIVIGLGWSLLQGLQGLERWARPADTARYLSDFMPLFSVVLMAGMGVQILLQALGWDVLFDRRLFERISAFALDMVIFSALATLSLEVIGSNWLALLLLCTAGVGWNLAVLFVLGPRMYAKPWFAYGVGDFGGGTATTASGIMLIKMVDPEKKTDALAAYADKQPFYEPFMGGGLVTALALPTVAALGAGWALAITATILAGWGVMAWRLRQTPA